MSTLLESQKDYRHVTFNERCVWLHNALMAYMPESAVDNMFNNMDTYAMLYRSGEFQHVAAVETWFNTIEQVLIDCRA